MLKQRLIASLLLRNGRLVKGVRFADHRDAGRANTTIRAHNAQGIDEIVLVDIDATRDKRSPDLKALEQVARDCMTPILFGGGVNSLAIAHECFRHGADKLLVTSAVWRCPELLNELAGFYGRQAVVAGIDVWNDGHAPLLLYDHISARPVAKSDPLELAQQAVDSGAGEIRLLNVSREGTRQGFDLQLLQRFKRALGVPVLIDGGAGTLEHVAAAFQANADGVCLGTMLVFSDNNIVKIKSYLEMRGCRIRSD